MRVTYEIRKIFPEGPFELLTPDFKDKDNAADVIISAKPDIFNHNLETVRRLYPVVRPQADYDYSLKLLDYIQKNSDIITKSGIMVGVGETFEELNELFLDLKKVKVSILQSVNIYHSNI